MAAHVAFRKPRAGLGSKQISQMTLRIILASILVWTLCANGCSGDSRRTLTLGIPTTVHDSGLLDALLPEFEELNPGYRVRYVAAGSGELLALGARGDVDVVLAHSPGAEERFVAAGHSTQRNRVMENDFVIVGPEDDPADILGMSDGAAALARIASAGAPFLSRGDDSGTHTKELELRESAGLTVGGPGYREAGQGMGAVLRAASETGAYTLCDIATYMKLRETLDLAVMVEGDPGMLNVYHVMVVALAEEPEAARAFARWLLSAGAQRVIGEYGRDRLSVSVFRPATGN